MRPSRKLHPIGGEAWTDRRTNRTGRVDHLDDRTAPDPTRGVIASNAVSYSSDRIGAVCKTVAKASEVRILHPPHAASTAPDQHVRGQGSILSSPVESSGVRLSTTGCGQIVGRWIASVWRIPSPSTRPSGSGHAPGAAITGPAGGTATTLAAPGVGLLGSPRVDGRRASRSRSAPTGGIACGCAEMAASAASGAAGAAADDHDGRAKSRVDLVLHAVSLDGEPGPLLVSADWRGGPGRAFRELICGLEEDRGCLAEARRPWSERRWLSDCVGSRLGCTAGCIPAYRSTRPSRTSAAVRRRG